MEALGLDSGTVGLDSGTVTFLPMTVSASRSSWSLWLRSVTALVVITVAGWCSPAVAQTDTPGAPKRGTVSILVSDTYGKPLRVYEIEITGDPSFRKVIREAGDVLLPYGTYRVRGTASMHVTFDRRLVVQSPKQLFLVAFSFRLHGEMAVLHTPLIGRVQNAPSGAGRLWVRVLSVFGSFAREAEIDPNGKFEIDSVPYGDYLVMVFRDFAVLKVHRFSKTVPEPGVIVDFAGK